MARKSFVVENSLRVYKKAESAPSQAKALRFVRENAKK
jgi:hypothetical protein